VKILFINPPETKMIRADNPEFIDEERGATPPLGLLYLAATARQQPGWEVEIIDCVGDCIDYQNLSTKIKKSSADLIGITTLTFTIFDVLETIKIIRSQSPLAKIILGGPHAHIYPEETLGWPGVDIVATGEGEAVLPGLMKNFPDLEKMKQVKGLIFKDKDDNIINTGKPDFISDFDSLPFPARDMTRINAYSSILSKRNPITTMLTSRGCPFRCRYCDRPHMGKRFRFYNPDYVVAEMQECENLGIGEAFIYDDTFTVNKKRVMDICKLKIDTNISLAFDIRARVDTVNEEMLRALKDAGCERIHYGIEAGTEKIQKVLDKGITLEQAEKAFAMTRKVGIKTLAYFMIGSPTETRQDIKDSITFATRINPDFVSITILTPFPETAIYFQALEEGVISHDYFREFARNPNPDFEVKYWEKELKREELFSELKNAYRRFYGRPGFIIKEAMQVRSFGELRKKFKMGLKVLGLRG
jgi:anaerobic magnesium-protoporphyrin IX monomethyl ester cyclase